MKWEVDITKFDNKTQQFIHVTTLKGLKKKDAVAIAELIIHTEDNSYSASARPTGGNTDD